MWGAVIGDLAGSIYEYGQVKKISKIDIKNLIDKNAFISDDTILTIAIIDAILNTKDYEKYLKEYATKYMNSIPKGIPYFEKMFSPGFSNWVNGKAEGKSIGNGAMMRISGVGYLFDSEEDIILNSKLATIPSHNNQISIESATMIALIIYYARVGLTKEEIINKLNIELKYVPFKEFNMTCESTIDNCLYAVFTSNSFEESIKKIISFGGDTDTNGAIVGSMAEALFGIDQAIIDEAKEKLPDEFNKVLTKAYRKVKVYEK